MPNLDTMLLQDQAELLAQTPTATFAQRTADTSDLPEVTTELSLLGSTSGRLTRFCYLVGDVFAITLGVISGKIAACWLNEVWWQPFSPVELKLFGLLSFSMLIVALWSGIYQAAPPRPARQFRTWTQGTLVVAGGILLAILLFDLAADTMVLSIVVAATIAHLAASFLRALCRISLGAKDWWGTRIIVVGSGASARAAMEHLVDEPQWGLRPVGYLCEKNSTRVATGCLPCLGTIDDLNDVANRTGVQRALVALDPAELQKTRDLFFRPDAAIRHWIVIPSTEFFNVLWSEWNETARMPSVTVSNRLANPRALRCKRIFDVVLTILICILLSPLFAGIWVLLKLTAGGPVFYKHRRIGIQGKDFYPWKFRTMVPNADQVLEEYLENNPDQREEWENFEKLKNDPRVTPIGRVLRATSLDELPQLGNVLQGDMSLVGPRPIVGAEAHRFDAVFEHYKQVVPGITGLWQVSGRNETSSEERMRLDSYYVENWSVWLDLYILACTVKVVILREGAY